MRNQSLLEDLVNLTDRQSESSRVRCRRFRAILAIRSACRDGNGILLIHDAGWHGRLEDVDVLAGFDRSLLFALSGKEKSNSLLDIALRSSSFGVALWLLSQSDIDWVGISSKAFSHLVAHQSPFREVQHGRKLDDLFPLFEEAGFDASISDESQNMLGLAVRGGNLSLIRILCQRCADCFPTDNISTACAPASKLNHMELVSHFLADWHVAVTAEDDEERSLRL
jgi:hypothetical protein